MDTHIMESMWHEKVRLRLDTLPLINYVQDPIVIHNHSQDCVNLHIGQYDATAAFQFCCPGVDVQGLRRLHQDAKA